MPSIEDNLSWGSYAWPEQGDEWSQDWGNAETQWHATILPRIRHFLPTKKVLEIAPGFGRWSKFLIDASESYVGIDLNAECIAACQKRFKAVSRAAFFTNDGKSLGAVADESIDFVFSFDSLVHVEIDVIEAYLQEISKKLTPDGIAFLHHSNLGQYGGLALKLSKLLGLPKPRWSLIFKVLTRLQISDWDRWRASSVTARKVADAAAANGLICIGQEVINWGRHNRRLIDCFTTLTRKGSRWQRPNVVVRNSDFRREARSAHAISRIYRDL